MDALPVWGQTLTVAGTGTLLLATLVGLLQTDAKTILAYSSIGKMGLLAAGVGLMLREPALAPTGSAALVLFAAHHGLVKGGLFLGVGLRKQAPRALQPATLVGLTLLALALSGAPLTSGALAKNGLKPLLLTAAPAVSYTIALGTVGAVLLMARWWWITVCLQPRPVAAARGSVAAWGLLIGCVLALPFALGSPADWFADVGGVMFGGALAGVALALARHGPRGVYAVYARWSARVPPGDILPLARQALARLRRRATDHRPTARDLPIPASVQ